MKIEARTDGFSASALLESSGRRRRLGPSSPLLVHAQHVGPELHRAFELEGVDQSEDQHGVHHHRHPEVLQDPSPPLVVHLGKKKRKKKRENDRCSTEVVNHVT